MTESQRVGQRLRSARLARGLTAEDVGQLLGKTKQTIYRYEMGISEPRYDDLPRFARLYGVTVAQIMDPKNAKARRTRTPKTASEAREEEDERAA